ncbi:15204_t:CDS:2 [Funneliformis geosporum]|nr:15204_t:CDS:2 [Funneliformis geosporum]
MRRFRDIFIRDTINWIDQLSLLSILVELDKRLSYDNLLEAKKCRLKFLLNELLERLDDLKKLSALE